jgi:hypothetical protein
MTSSEVPVLVSDSWPGLAAELAATLRAIGEDGLAAQVMHLRVLDECDCGDGFCQSFYTQPPPVGAYGPGHRNIALSPDRSGMLVLDVVDYVIMFVEVVDRPPLA